MPIEVTVLTVVMIAAAVLTIITAAREAYSCVALGFIVLALTFATGIVVMFA